jgi:hypothetical protein
LGRLTNKKTLQAVFTVNLTFTVCAQWALSIIRVLLE